VIFELLSEGNVIPTLGLRDEMVDDEMVDGR